MEKGFNPPPLNHKMNLSPPQWDFSTQCTLALDWTSTLMILILLIREGGGDSTYSTAFCIVSKGVFGIETILA